MKNLINVLKLISIGLGILSLFFAIFSLSISLEFDDSVGFIETVVNISKALESYSELYKFTFIVSAFWVTLNQLKISTDNYNTTLTQVKFVQEDILDKRKKDINDETLKQCNFYLNDLQVSFKELIESGITTGMHLNWEYLKPITFSSLKEKYIGSYNKFAKFDREKKNQALLTLYKLEAFSALFVYGSLDKQLAKEIIGHTYAKQVGFLLGIIAYFREDNNSIFASNIIKLYNEWKTIEVIE